MRGHFSRRVVLVGIAALLLSGCARQAAPVAAQALVVKAEAEYPVIVRIVSRGQTVVVTAGPEGALYSVQSPTGEMLVSNVTLEELRGRHPEHYKWIAPMVANEMTVVADVQAGR
jgi:type IV pilus biogenesis protein CpaD/CtpE